MASTKSSYMFSQISSSQSSADTTNSTGCKSSLESDHETKDLYHQITLHLVTDPGLVKPVSNSYRNLLSCLHSNLCEVVQICERQQFWNKRKTKEKGPSPPIPSLALVIFCFDSSTNHDVTESRTQSRSRDKKTEFEVEDDDSAFYESEQNNLQHPKTYSELRQRLMRKPWIFHHKINISGSMMLCDSNIQDFYYYSSSKDFAKDHFPLFAVRKIHAGRPILRMTIFVSYKNWNLQIKFYSQLSGHQVTKVRDDFCFFDLDTSMQKIKLQLGLKRLPEGLHPTILFSTFLEFDIASSDVITSLPCQCEKMSDLRMRTKDYDGNTVILSFNSQIRDEIRNREEKMRRSRSVSPYSQKITKQMIFKNPKKKESNFRVGRTKLRSKRSDLNLTSPLRSTAHEDDSHETNLYSRLKPRSRPRSSKMSQNHPEVDPQQGRSNFGMSTNNDSFTFPQLPEKMPLLKENNYLNLNRKKKSRKEITDSDPERSKILFKSDEGFYV